MLDRLRALDTCAGSDALDTLNLAGAPTGSGRLWAVTEPVAGRVRTVQAGPRQSGKPAQHIAAAAIEAAGPGDVLVIGKDGRTRVAGVQGVPVSGRAVGRVSARGRIVQLEMAEPVEFAGLVVHPGDVVLADAN